MKCCVNCFKDSEIIGIVSGVKTEGDCDFCGSTNVAICNLDYPELKNNFERLLDVYAPVSEFKGEIPRHKTDMIKNILSRDWSIFNLEPEKIDRFLMELLQEQYQANPELFDGPVLLKGTNQEDYLKQFSILGVHTWEDFTTEIKTKNRFHTEIINKDLLRRIVNFCNDTYQEGQVFYRARIMTAGENFTKEEMGPPPPGKASAGRANPEGISCLYLSDSRDTTLHETRSGMHDAVTVGTFILRNDIEVVDLTAIDKISPFLMQDIDLIAANIDHLRKIGNEISKPLRRHESTLNYLPTQFISDYIKSIGLAGIKYESTMRNNGINLAIFDENLFECTEVENYNISAISYSFKTFK
ncbi:RES family NAD+ phosphorylase [Fundicoccus culcitae]|uniref:RES family NAD+ phosphorylase n=1 Tax=Fundicoccus culcitae TaxID=2969821 RepID=A0ABY5P8W6_9LACT|nr:RES family NAD+ phosphorylase [Fundicoccus culcitae]UUX35187.1 RES family NAD+ phosphorylase [Fundicoccus culcitae]